MSPTTLIGIDGATFSLLDPLMADGTMPRLGELVGSGTRAELMSTPNPLTAQAWPSIATGRSPGNHGLLDFVHFEEGDDGRRFTITTSRDLRCETVWSIAGRQGKTSTVLNFFGLFPPVPHPGHSIAGFVPARHLKDAVHPPELFEELRGLPGVDHRELAMDLDLERKCIQGLQRGEYEDWVQLHLRRERHWLEIIRHLEDTAPSDVMAVVFDGADKLQHACWRFIDPDCLPEHPNRWERQIRDLCLSYYRQLDEVIGEIVALRGADNRTFVVSDHGFGPTTEIFYLNSWLAQRGDLSWRDSAEVAREDRLGTDRMKSQARMIDWTGTRAHAVTPSSNGVFIRSSEGQNGGSSAHNGYEAYREHLASDLLGFDAGGQVVTNVRTREEAYPGREGIRGPDLLLTLRDHGFISTLRSDVLIKKRDQPAGTHRPEGIFIAAGPGIRSGERVEALSLLDVAPLLLYSEELAIPGDLEGRVPESVFDPAVTRERPPRVAGSTESIATESSGEEATPVSDNPEVLERLRALGYFE